jgi:endonuclease YncB( thermonuclease family)
MLMQLLAMLALQTADAEDQRARVVDIYDGDTLTLSNGEKVRLRGVNTPELRPMEEYGIEAREAARDLLLHREVLLSYGTPERDGYGRILASVTTLEGEDLGAMLLERGLGHLFIIPPDNLDVATMLAAQASAQAANRGVWSTERYRGDLHITSFHANAAGDDNSNVNGEYLRLCNITSNPVDVQGYTIRDISGRSWPFPQLIIPPGHTVEVHSGRGRHQVDPTKQLTIYLDSSRPIWNNVRDRATIYDRFGKVVDSRPHEVQNPN